MSDLVWKEPRSSGQPWIASVDERVEYKVRETREGIFLLECASGALVEFVTLEAAKRTAEDLHSRR